LRWVTISSQQLYEMPSCNLFLVDKIEIVLRYFSNLDSLVVLINEFLLCLFILQHLLIVLPNVHIALVKALTHRRVYAHPQDGVEAHSP
jgi:hypothetical protein